MQDACANCPSTVSQGLASQPNAQHSAGVSEKRGCLPAGAEKPWHNQLVDVLDQKPKDSWGT